MSADAYLQEILRRESVDTGAGAPVREVQARLTPVIQEWAGRYLSSIGPSGSFAKGTANRSGTDIDLFISLSEFVPTPMREVYASFANKLTERGFVVRRQNVSLGVSVAGYAVDLVPAKRQDSYSGDHTLYRRKADTWTKTNVATHINYVQRGGCIAETRLLKLWRDQKGLDFPSFYLELSTIHALQGASGGLSERVWRVFHYLQDTFPRARVIDPANTNNIISDDLTQTERDRVRISASTALQAKNWSDIIR